MEKMERAYISPFSIMIYKILKQSYTVANSSSIHCKPNQEY